MLTRKLTIKTALAFAILALSMIPSPSQANQPATSTDSIFISGAGIGPINKSTLFNAQKIKALFPNLTVKESVAYAEGTAYKTISLNKGTVTLANINPDIDNKKIYNIIIHSSAVQNKLGPKIGSLYSDAYKGNVTVKCVPGVEELSGQVFCIDPKAPNVSYLFSGKTNGPDGQVPPQATLKSWKMDKIYWTP